MMASALDYSLSSPAFAAAMDYLSGEVANADDVTDTKNKKFKDITLPKSQAFNKSSEEMEAARQLLAQYGIAMRVSKDKLVIDNPSPEFREALCHALNREMDLEAPLPPQPAAAAPAPPVVVAPAPAPPVVVVPAPAPAVVVVPAPAPAVPVVPAPAPAVPVVPAPAPAVPVLPAPAPAVPVVPAPVPAPVTPAPAPAVPVVPAPAPAPVTPAPAPAVPGASAPAQAPAPAPVEPPPAPTPAIITQPSSVRANTLQQWLNANSAAWEAGSAVTRTADLLGMLEASCAALSPADEPQLLNLAVIIGNCLRVALERLTESLKAHGAPADLTALQRFADAETAETAAVVAAAAAAAAGAGTGAGAGLAAMDGLRGGAAPALYPVPAAAATDGAAACWLAATTAIVVVLNRCVMAVAGATQSFEHPACVKLLVHQGTVEALGAYNATNKTIEACPPLRVLLLGSHAFKKGSTVDIMYSAEYMASMAHMDWEFMRHIAFVGKSAERPNEFEDILRHSFPKDGSYLPPHILHISTHSDGENIRISEKQGKSVTRRKVSVSELGELIAEMDPKPLALILNCCKTRKIMDEMFNPKYGIHCVIGTSVNIKNSTAMTFASSFYKALSHGLSLPAAFHFARATLPAAERHVMLMRCRPANPEEQVAAWEDASLAKALGDDTAATVAIEAHRKKLADLIASIGPEARANLDAWRKAEARVRRLKRVKAEARLVLHLMSMDSADESAEAIAVIAEAYYGRKVPIDTDFAAKWRGIYSSKVVAPIEAMYPALARDGSHGMALVEQALALATADAQAANTARLATEERLNLQSALIAELRAVAEQQERLTGQSMKVGDEVLLESLMALDADIITPILEPDADDDDAGTATAPVDVTINEPKPPHAYELHLRIAEWEAELERLAAKEELLNSFILKVKRFLTILANAKDEDYMGDPDFELKDLAKVLKQKDRLKCWNTVAEDSVAELVQLVADAKGKLEVGEEEETEEETELRERASETLEALAEILGDIGEQVAEAKASKQEVVNAKALQEANAAAYTKTMLKWNAYSQAQNAAALAELQAATAEYNEGQQLLESAVKQIAAKVPAGDKK